MGKGIFSGDNEVFIGAPVTADILERFALEEAEAVSYIVEDRTVFTGKVNSKIVTGREVKVAALKEAPEGTLLSESYTEGDGITPGNAPIIRLTTENDELFTAGDLIYVQGVQGYEADGTTPSERELVLYVVEMSLSNGLMVQALNGKTHNGVPNCIPSIEEGVSLFRMGNAVETVDKDAVETFSSVPCLHNKNYCQKFVYKAAYTDDALQKLAESGISLEDLIEIRRKSFVNAIDLAYLKGVQESIYVRWNTTGLAQREVKTCEGLWYQAESQFDYTTNSFSVEKLVEFIRDFTTRVTHLNSTEIPVLLCGSRLKAYLNEHISIAGTINELGTVVKVEDGPIFDDLGMSENGIIYYPSALVECVYSPYRATTTDNNGITTIEINQCSCLVAKDKSAVMRIVRR